MTKIEALRRIATRLRIHSLKMTTRAGSGHPTTCLSMAELAACLFFHEMRYNPRNPNDWANDEFILSKGHAAPILWAAYAEAGIIPQESLLDLRRVTSELEGHPTPRMKWVKTATGSLGQGLSVGVGMALAQKLAGSPARTFVLMGDGECAEGAVWEAANAAFNLTLNNLIAVIDVNRLGQSEATMHGHDLAAYERKFRTFGWEVYRVNGHDIRAIVEALTKTRQAGRPSVLLAKTIKGKGVSFLEDRNGWHGRPLKEEELVRALDELGPMPEVDSSRYVSDLRRITLRRKKNQFEWEKTDYSTPTATRLAYGIALQKLGEVNERVIALDGDVKNSTYAEKFFEAFPERSFQTYIAEQNMVGMGMGLAAKGFVPFIATFAAFLSRAHDQIRMASYSFSNLKFCGSHAGVSIGEDGGSQMGLEDLAMMRAVAGSTVLYPSDAVSAEKLVEQMALRPGLCYLRTSRPKTPVIYGNDEAFPVGGAKVLRQKDGDRVTVVAAGVTLHEALKAAEVLAAQGIGITVIDAYSIKPLASDVILAAARRTANQVLTVEDHYAEGGLGDAVAGELSAQGVQVHKLAVRELPRSGKPAELLARYGIDADAIVAKVRSMA